MAARYVLQRTEKVSTSVRKRLMVEPLSTALASEERRLHIEVSLKLKKEGMMLHQKARANRFKWRDAISLYFHALPKKRKADNAIRCLEGLRD